MNRFFCTLLLMVFSLTLIGQVDSTKVNFCRPSKGYADVVWVGVENGGLYISHKSMFLKDRQKVQGKNEEIELTDIVDLVETNRGYNTLRVTIYDGSSQQSFSIDRGYIFEVSPPQKINKKDWEWFKKNHSKY